LTSLPCMVGCAVRHAPCAHLACAMRHATIWLGDGPARMHALEGGRATPGFAGALQTPEHQHKLYHQHCGAEQPRRRCLPPPEGRTPEHQPHTTGTAEQSNRSAAAGTRQLPPPSTRAGRPRAPAASLPRLLPPPPSLPPCAGSYIKRLQAGPAPLLLHAAVQQPAGGAAQQAAGVAEQTASVAEQKAGVAEQKAGVAERMAGVAEHTAAELEPVCLDTCAKVRQLPDPDLSRSMEAPAWHLPGTCLLSCLPDRLCPAPVPAGQGTGSAMTAGSSPKP
jgi:hypothetical protein